MIRILEVFRLGSCSSCIYSNISGSSSMFLTWLSACCACASSWWAGTSTLDLCSISRFQFVLVEFELVFSKIVVCYTSHSIQSVEIDILRNVGVISWKNHTSSYNSLHWNRVVLTSNELFSCWYCPRSLWFYLRTGKNRYVEARCVFSVQVHLLGTRTGLNCSQESTNNVLLAV